MKYFKNLEESLLSSNNDLKRVIQEHILSIKLFYLKIMFRQLNKFKLIFTLMSEINESLSDKTNLIKLRISTRAHVKRREI